MKAGIIGVGAIGAATAVAVACYGLACVHCDLPFDDDISQ